MSGRLVYFDNKPIGVIEETETEILGHTDYRFLCDRDPYYSKVDNKTYMADGTIEYDHNCVESELIRIAMEAKRQGKF